VGQPSTNADLPRHLPLVGRKAELERLYRLFGHESRVEPVALIMGDPGVGKSRLAESVATEARRRGWKVVEGRAYPVESGIPFGLISDAFLPVLEELDDATLTVLTRGTSSDLRQLFPSLGRADAKVEVGDPRELQTRLFWSFTEFLKRLAERSPLLIVADDLHWADASSLSLLHFMARQLQGEPIRILAAASWGYTRDHENLGRMERSLASLKLLDRQDLEPLSPEATTELLQAVFHVGGAPLEDFSTHLYAWTHGNPYILEETLRALVQTGRLYVRDGTWLGWEVRNLELPTSVRDTLLTRLEALSESARATADLLAVTGGRAPVRLVGLVADLNDDALMEAVTELTDRAVAVEREEGPDVIVQLRHPMLRETLYQSLGPMRRRHLHRQVAEGLEELYRGQAAPVDQLAYHFTRGGPRGADPRATRYLAEAGRSALHRHADNEAVAYLQAALDRYPEHVETGRTPLPTRPEFQADLARGLARLGRYGDASTLWNELLGEARVRGDAAGAAQALHHLGLLAYWSGRHDEALRRYDEALQGIDGQDLGALEARVLLAAGVALQELGRADDALVRVESCLELARSLDDPGLLGRAHRALALLFTWVGQAAEARQHGWQAVELADQVGDSYVRFWGRYALASLEGLTGRTDEMADLMRQAGQVADELRSPVLRLWTAELEVEYLSATGDWDGALALGERAVQMADSLSQTTLLPRLLVWTGMVYVGRGDLARAREMVDRAWALAGLDDADGSGSDVHVAVTAHIGAAACLLAEERYDEAVAVGEAGIALADRAGYVFWSLHHLLPIVAEAHLRRRDLQSALAAGRRLHESGERMGHRLAVAWANACDAFVMWLSGDAERGLELLQEAARSLEAIPMTHDAARLRRQVAGRLFDLGRRDEGLAELRHVHDVFLELGAKPELDRCRDMFRQQDSRPPPRPDGPTAATLTPKEWAVAQQVALRQSNKAIGKALGIKERTAATHLRNIYRKLGISSRGQLLDMVREGRLSAPAAEEE